MEQVGNSDLACFDIKNLTVINLDWLFDLSMRNGSFQILADQIDSYWRILGERKAACAKQFDHYTYLNAKTSFDETYQHIFIKALPNVSDSMNKMEELLDRAGLTQDILNEIV